MYAYVLLLSLYHPDPFFPHLKYYSEYINNITLPQSLQHQQYKYIMDTMQHPQQFNIRHNSTSDTIQHPTQFNIRNNSTSATIQHPQQLYIRNNSTSDTTKLLITKTIITIIYVYNKNNTTNNKYMCYEILIFSNMYIINNNNNNNGIKILRSILH